MPKVLRYAGILQSVLKIIVLLNLMFSIPKC